MSLMDDLRSAEHRISDAQIYIKNRQLKDAIYEVEQAYELIESAIDTLEYLMKKKGDEDE